MRGRRIVHAEEQKVVPPMEQRSEVMFEIVEDDASMDASKRII